MYIKQYVNAYVCSYTQVAVKGRWCLETVGQGLNHGNDLIMTVGDKCGGVCT